MARINPNEEDRLSTYFICKDLRTGQVQNHVSAIRYDFAFWDYETKVVVPVDYDFLIQFPYHMAHIVFIVCPDDFVKKSNRILAFIWSKLWRISQLHFFIVDTFIAFVMPRAPERKRSQKKCIKNKFLS